jgi:hypothetical protein
MLWWGTFACCFYFISSVSSHATIGFQAGEGRDAFNNPSFLRSAYGYLGGYGSYTYLRIPHSQAGMYTYKIEILLPSIGTRSQNKSLSSVKPEEVGGWQLSFDDGGNSNDPNVLQMITYTAYLGNELSNAWHMQISISVAINCVNFHDPLVVPCGNTVTGNQTYALLFPVRQHLCVKGSSGVCVPNGQVEDWSGYTSPASFTPLGSCSASSVSNPCPALKFYQSPKDIKASCPAISITPAPFTLPLNFSKPVYSNSGIRMQVSATSSASSSRPRTALVFLLFQLLAMTIPHQHSTFHLFG